MERSLIAVYILTNKAYGILYIGVTGNLYQRIEQHRTGIFDGFTKKHGLKRLVWFETHEDITSAIRREKALKRYLRDWKINLIERDNPGWLDLSQDWDRMPAWNSPPI